MLRVKPSSRIKSEELRVISFESSISGETNPNPNHPDHPHDADPPSWDRPPLMSMNSIYPLLLL